MSLNQEPLQLYEPIKYTLSMGGKRIRPCLALMTHSLFSDKLDDALGPALALEIFHNFTLLHDDIMDNAALRRNHQTVHLKWNINTAILSGDAMMILAYHHITITSVKLLPRIMYMFNKTALEVCEGQQLDMNYESWQSITEEQYLQMIRLKTAVLLAASLALGGITGNATDVEVEKLYKCGLNIGMAFQLQDDYLDAFANREVFGKDPGGDIVANKKTYLLISALNSGNTAVVNTLRDWIRKEKFDPAEKIKEVLTIYNTLGVDRKNIELTNSYFNKGISFLDQLEVRADSKSEIRKLITALMQRER